MIENSKVIQETTENRKETLGRNLELPEVRDIRQMKLTDEQLEQRAELSAQLACKFFGLSCENIQKGSDIQVKKNDTEKLSDDVLEYNIEQFKQMGCTSISDMTKVWFHECGHRLLQDIYPDSWTDELGADFFAGVVSELTGFSKGNMERFLTIQTPSDSHPGGSLRLMAMDYGRFVAFEMKTQGIRPSWENCIEVFKASPFPDLKKEEVPKEDPAKGTRFYGPLDTPPVTISTYPAGPVYNTYLGNMEVHRSSSYFNNVSSHYEMTKEKAIDIFITEGLKEARIDPTTPAGEYAYNTARYNAQMENIRYEKRQEDFKRACNPDNYKYRGHYSSSSLLGNKKNDKPSKVELFKADVSSRINTIKEFFSFRHLDWKSFSWLMPKEHNQSQERLDNKNDPQKYQMGLNMHPKIGEFAEQKEKKKSKKLE